MLSGIWI